MSAKKRSPVTGARLVANGEELPRLSAVVERQRRELARVRAEREATVLVAMARGVLMERHGWSSVEAARQLAAMAAVAGELAVCDHEAEMEFGLELILDGVRRRVTPAG